MSEHLSPQQIKMFLQDLLTGDEALGVLLHLEECHQCFDLMPEQNPEQMWDLLFGDGTDLLSDDELNADLDELDNSENDSDQDENKPGKNEV